MSKTEKAVSGNIIENTDMVLPKGNYIINIDTGIGKISKTMVVGSSIRIETIEHGVAIPVTEQE